MPLLARLLIRTALGYLAAALLLGLALTPTSIEWMPVFAGLRAPQIHLLVVGWLTQLIFGVAFWLFPRHSRERPFGPAWMVWVAYGVLNAGLVLRAIAEPGRVEGMDAELLIASAGLQCLAAVLFASYFWTRVRAK